MVGRLLFFNYLIMISMMGFTQPLSSYQWKNRILILNDGKGIEEQLSAMDSESAGMEERDLLIITLKEDNATIGGRPLSKNDLDEIKNIYDIPTNEFKLILIGKDGTVKLQESRFVNPWEIFALIDSMPMRRNEMRKIRSNH